MRSDLAIHLVGEAVIPCTTMGPEIAHALLTERQPGDLLRVTGHLTLPGTADGVMRPHADTLEVLWEAPVGPASGQPSPWTRRPDVMSRFPSYEDSGGAEARPARHRGWHGRR